MSVRVSRSATASWQGTVPDGGGRIGLGSGAFDGLFTLRNRVEDAVRGTNPEELIAAAQAGCFTMSLADLLSGAGSPPQDLRTTVRVRLEQKEQGFRITRVAVTTVGDVPGIDEERFIALAQQAKDTCPVSLALAGTEITLEASLQTPVAQGVDG
ncbi:MAG TPA: OsmC family peroxiredoxin [Solirubrobacteraceae bacterium]|nr:OsmC family peroxiredoxin [Solirubrobacteraceae bacterium]